MAQSPGAVREAEWTNRWQRGNASGRTATLKVSGTQPASTSLDAKGLTHASRRWKARRKRTAC
jgi:hypothetical protein